MARTKPKLVDGDPVPAPKWPAAEVSMRPIASVLPRATNPRTHSPAQVAQIAASIRAWGWTVPLLVDEAGNLIAGHGRLQAAHQLGLQQVPCMTARLKLAAGSADRWGVNMTIEELRTSVATCLLSADPATRQRGSDFLRMIEVLKVQMLAKGASVTVTSREGTKWGRK